MSGLNADAESGDEYAPHDRRCRDGDEHEAAEDTPLLPTDLPAELIPERSLRLLVSVIGGLCLTLVGVSQRLFGPALQEIMEDVICRDVYADHQLNTLSHPDSRCKGNDVQKILSMVSAVDTSAEMIVRKYKLVSYFYVETLTACTAILVQIPYGIIADKYGRRIVIFLSLFGCALKIGWTVVVRKLSLFLIYLPVFSSLNSALTSNLVSLPNTLNIWAILWGNLAYFIGGGGTMAGAMCYTLFSDVTPAAERTIVFYQLNAVLRIVGVAATPLAAFLLGVNPWMALWIGIGLLVVGTGCTLLLPETLDLRKMADQRGPSRDVRADFAPQEVAKVSAKSAVQQALASARSDFSHIWRFVLGSQGIMLLMVCNALAFPLKLVFEGDLLQYMTKRYHWSWSTVEFCPCIRSGEQLLT